MATLQKIRDRFGVLVAVFIGVSLLSFIVFTGKNNSIFSSPSKKLEVARINGKSVSIRYYQAKIDSLTAIYKLSGNQQIDEETAKKIRQQVWEEMVRENVLAPEYKELGIAVSPEELYDLVNGDNPHPIVRQLFSDPSTGYFDRNAVINFIKQMKGEQKAYWLYFEKQIVNERKIAKLLTLIGKGLYPTDFQAQQTYLEDNKKASFQYISQLFDVVSDSSVTITRKDLQAYYDKHKENFKQTASRKIEYVTFDVVPSRKDDEDALEWITRIKPEFEQAENAREFVNLNSDVPYADRHYAYGELTPDTLNDIIFKAKPGFVYGPYLEDGTYKLAKLVSFDMLPDSVHARHILVAFMQNTTKEEIRHKADSIKNLIEKGADFAVLAMTMSDDKGSARLGGDLGWFREGMMVKPFSDACFFGNKGDIRVVETQYGYHVIEILDQSKKVKKAAVAFLQRKVEPSSATYNAIYSQASRFAGTNNTYEKFNKAIEENGLNKHVAVVGKNDENIPGLDSPRPLIRAAFNTDKDHIILDATSQAVFELGDRFVVGYVTEIKKDGYAPLEDVEAEIRHNVLRDKKAEVLIAALKEKMKDAKTLDELAQKTDSRIREASDITFNSFTIPAAGIEPALNAVAYVWPPERLTPPVKGLNAVYVVNITSVTDPEPKADFSLEKMRLKTEYITRANYEAYEALKKQADVKDERSKFY